MQGEEEQLILDSAVESLYEKESEITFEDRVESLLHTVKKVNIRDSLKMTILHHICIQCDQFKTEMHFIDTLKVLLFTVSIYIYIYIWDIYECRVEHTRKKLVIRSS